MSDGFTLVRPRRKESFHKPQTDEEIIKDNTQYLVDYEEVYNKEKARITDELKIIDRFIARICRNFCNLMVEAERNGRKYCYLFKYNDDPDKGEIFNDTIEGLDTKYVLSGKWIYVAKQYFSPQKCRSIEHRLNDYINDKKYNNGIDPVTNNPYRVSVFHYKGPKSVFSNGIICSRDGHRYN